MNEISREGGRLVIHVSIRPKLKKNNQKLHFDQLSVPPDQWSKRIIQTSDLSLNTIYKIHKRDPFSTLLDATKYRTSPKRRRKYRRRCGFLLWILCLLCYCLIALLAILAALFLGLFQKNKNEPSSTVTTTTSTSSTTTTSTTTTSTTTTSTTSQTTTTTTTHKDCLSLTIFNGTDYYGFNIISKSATTFIDCCEFCFTTPQCAVFTFRTAAGGSGCFLKNSTAGGQVADPNCISALM